MKLISPIKGVSGVSQISDKPIYISQRYGNVWIADRDMTVGGVFIKKGENVYKKIAGMNGHNGDDYVAPKGTPVYASHSGYITYENDAEGYGGNARIKFNEEGFTWELIFGHMSKFEGSKRNINQGEVLGYVGSTGFSTGNHLHHGLRKYKNGKIVDYNNGFLGWIDPMPFITKGQDTMKLVKDKGTTYLTGGKNVKWKIGIAEPFVLGIFGDEEVDEGDLSHIKTEYTLSQGKDLFVINRK